MLMKTLCMHLYLHVMYVQLFEKILSFLQTFLDLSAPVKSFYNRCIPTFFFDKVLCKTNKLSSAYCSALFKFLFDCFISPFSLVTRSRISCEDL